eukprot:gene13445-biopygen8027
MGRGLGRRDLGILAFAPRSEPLRTHAPGTQMIRMSSGSSLAFQRRSRGTLFSNLGVRMAETVEEGTAPHQANAFCGAKTDLGNGQIHELHCLKTWFSGRESGFVPTSRARGSTGLRKSVVGKIWLLSLIEKKRPCPALPQLPHSNACPPAPPSAGGRPPAARCTARTCGSRGPRDRRAVAASAVWN